MVNICKCLQKWQMCDIAKRFDLKKFYNWLVQPGALKTLQQIKPDYPSFPKSEEE